MMFLRTALSSCCAVWVSILPAAGAWGEALDADTATKGLHVADGMEVELFANEPMIRQPVTMSFDERGRLWVVQYIQYPIPAGLKAVSRDQYDRVTYDRIPEPPPSGPAGADRVTILEDTDGDGRADKAIDFVTGLNLATGLALGHGGVWVLQSPYLLFYPDRDQDDVPDGDPEVRVAHFGIEDPHALANSLQWGPDGWLYGVHGSTVTANIRGIEFQQGIWRYHPITKEFELFSEGGGNSYGLDFDARGQAIVGSNYSVPGLHQVQGAYYIKNFGKHGALHNPFTFGYFGHMPHEGASIGKLSVGGIIYQADALPPSLRGMFLTTNGLNHAVYIVSLHRLGSTYRSRFEGKVLWSDDRWFQPIDLALAPDGSVFVADWYDSDINYQRTLRNMASFDRKRGRIYRIFATGNQRTDSFDLRKLSSDELVDLQSHDNNWYAVEARRLLAERRDESVIPRLRQLTISADGSLALKSLWALYVSGAFDDELAIGLLGHKNEDVRAWTVRLLGDRREVSAEVTERLVLLAREETSPIVRSQMACTSKRLPADSALPIVAQLLCHDEDANDPFMPLLLWWAVEDKAISDCDRVLQLAADREFWKRPLPRTAIAGRLARRFAAENTDQGFAACARLLAMAPGAADTDLLIRAMEQEFQGRRLDRTPPAMEEPLAELWAKGPPNVALVQFMLRLGSQSAYQNALELIADTDTATDDRLSLLSAVGESGRSESVPVLLDLLKENEPASIRTSAMAGLGRYEDDRIARVVLATYPTMEPELRDRARLMMYGRKRWSMELLRTVDTGSIEGKEIPSVELRSLLAHQEPQINELVEKLWGKVRTTPPQELQHRMLEIAELLDLKTGNSKRGKDAFAKHCGTCHKLNGKGYDIGPDLTGYPRHDLGYVLSSVIDPNAIIRPEYQVHVVITDNGRVLTGLLAESKPKTIVILDAKNQRTVIARDEIDEMETSKLSLMPERILKESSEQEICDLFAYVQAGTDRPLDKSLAGLGIARSTFTVGTGQWTIADNGAGDRPVIQSSGGNPGGWIRLDDQTSGKMAVVAPRSFLGNLTRFDGGGLSFDARTVDSRGGSAHTCFGEIAITGAGRTVRTDAAPDREVPGAQWSTYRVPLTADTFGASPDVWESILADVTGIAITIEAFASSSETMGLDNVMLLSRSPD